MGIDTVIENLKVNHEDESNNRWAVAKLYNYIIKSYKQGTFRFQKREKSSTEVIQIL